MTGQYPVACNCTLPLACDQAWDQASHWVLFYARWRGFIHLHAPVPCPSRQLLSVHVHANKFIYKDRYFYYALGNVEIICPHNTDLKQPNQCVFNVHNPNSGNEVLFSLIFCTIFQKFTFQLPKKFIPKRYQAETIKMIQPQSTYDMRFLRTVSFARRFKAPTD